MINEKQSKSNWGDKVIQQLSKGLRQEFPETKGLSSSNLKYSKRFYIFYQTSIGQQPVDQLEQSPFFYIP